MVHSIHLALLYQFLIFNNISNSELIYSIEQTNQTDIMNKHSNYFVFVVAVSVVGVCVRRASKWTLHSHKNHHFSMAALFTISNEYVLFAIVLHSFIPLVFISRGTLFFNILIKSYYLNKLFSANSSTRSLSGSLFSEYSSSKLLANQSVNNYGMCSK